MTDRDREVQSLDEACQLLLEVTQLLTQTNRRLDALITALEPTLPPPAPTVQFECYQCKRLIMATRGRSGRCPHCQAPWSFR